jgi:hypothetical protein
MRAYLAVLAADYAALLVQEFGRNPVVSEEAAFDLYPPFVVLIECDIACVQFLTLGLLTQILQHFHSALLS